MLKKLSITFFLSLFLLSNALVYFPKNTYAQANPWYAPSFPEFFGKVYDTNSSPPSEIFGERYTAAQVTWVIYSLISFVMTAPFANKQTIACIVAGGGTIDFCIGKYPIDQPPQGYLLPQQDPNQSFLATMFSPQRSLSGVTYVRQSLSKLHIIPEAQAQGFGFNALNPIQNTWKIFRDITYALFIVIIIIMAFMIMFRYKISPQTVITVQSALPKIVITLILVTFSYAIAGFLIDLTYVAIGLIALVFNQVGLISGAGWADYFNLLTIGPIIGGHGTGLLGWFLVFIPAIIMSAVGFFFSATGISGGWGVAGAIFGEVVGIILAFIFIVWAAVALVKTFILLIKTYINVLIKVVFSPLQIGLGAVASGGFGAWMMSLLSDLAVYPAVGALFMVALMFISASYSDTASITWLQNSLGLLPGPIQSPLACPNPPCPSWYPPLTFGVQDLATNFDPLPFLWALAALGMLSVIPKVGDIVKAAAAGKLGAVGVDMGGFFGPAKGAGLTAGGYLAGRAVGTASATASQAEWESKRYAPGSANWADEQRRYHEAAAKQRARSKWVDRFNRWNR